jgi:hypothetical protein
MKYLVVTTALLFALNSLACGDKGKEKEKEKDKSQRITLIGR